MKMKLLLAALVCVLAVGTSNTADAQQSRRWRDDVFVNNGPRFDDHRHDRGRHRGHYKRHRRGPGRNNGFYQSGPRGRRWDGHRGPGRHHRHHGHHGRRDARWGRW